MKSRISAVAVVVLVVLGGCASGGGNDRGDQTRYVHRGLDRADASVGADTAAADAARQSAAQHAPVMVGGEAIGWDVLRPRLAEAAGAEVVDEVALDRLVEGECRRRNISVTPEEIDAERTLLIDTLSDTGRRNLPSDQLEQLIARLRTQRGLGPQRWAALLRRNAMLRALIADQVTVSDEAVERMHQRLYGPDYPARLIVTSTAIEASEAIGRIKNGEPFGVVAAEMSTDPSADRGGIIDPINTADPTWPQAIRTTVEQLAAAGKIGQVGGVPAVSDPILLDSGYAILWIERAPAPKQVPTIDAVRPELERLVRTQQERLLMQREARQLLGGADITVLDPSLEWSRQSHQQ